MKNLKITHCFQCPHHEIINDTDPYDSFNDNDCAIICKKLKNPNRDTNSVYRADWSEFKIVSCALRPYEVKKIEIPKWCPL